MVTTVGAYERFTLHLRVPLLVQDDIDYDEEINLEDSCNFNSSRASDNEGHATDIENQVEDREHSSSHNERES